MIDLKENYSSKGRLVFLKEYRKPNIGELYNIDSQYRIHSEQAFNFFSNKEMPKGLCVIIPIVISETEVIEAGDRFVSSLVNNFFDNAVVKICKKINKNNTQIHSEDGHSFSIDRSRKILSFLSDYNFKDIISGKLKEKDELLISFNIDNCDTYSKIEDNKWDYLWDKFNKEYKKKSTNVSLNFYEWLKETCLAPVEINIEK